MKLHKAFMTSAPTLLLKFTWVILLVLLLSVSVSCKRQGMENKLKDPASDSTAFFNPNPQKVPHHEITTLAIGQKAVYFNLPDISGRFCSLDDFETPKYLC